MSNRIKVVVVGAAGRMGKTICQAVLDDDGGGLDLVGAVDTADVGGKVPGSELSLEDSLEKVIEETIPDVLVDFTNADAVVKNADLASAAGVDAVIGTTGIPAGDLDRLKGYTEQRKSNILYAPNFAIGAVVMMNICRNIASVFDRAEIIELHHDQKIDAPSGTAVMTAEIIGDNLKPDPLEEVEKYKGARGARVKGIPVHSVRLPGLVAHQEVIFGLIGQTLTIRHDSIDRSSFMPGIILAVKAIGSRAGFSYGLESFLGLSKVTT